MTAAALLLAGALVAVRAVETLAEVLNLRALQPVPPAGLETLYDGDRYARSQEYTRARTRFGWVSSWTGLLVLLAFWAGGGFEGVDRWVRQWGASELVAGLVYIGLLLFFKDLVSLPFQVHATFGLEERFGFNRTTPATFVMDRLKGYLLTLVLGGPLLAGLLWLFSRWGSSAWFWAWVWMTVFSVFLQFVAPTWIMPLFNKFTPLPDGELRREIFKYAQSVGFPLTNVFIMDGSKRSSKANAFFTGFGKNKRIALFDTLVAKHTVPEMVSVLAHEIGHYQKRHVIKGMFLGIAQSGVLFFFLGQALHGTALFDLFGIQTPSVHTGLAVFGVLYTPLAFLLEIPLQAYSRHNEFEADRYAVDTIGTPAPLAQGLKTLAASTLTNLTPHPFYVFLNHTHPPLRERLAALQRH